MNDPDLNTLYTFNPSYRLRKDKNRIFIINSSTDPSLENFNGFIHPIYAIVLSLFDGKLTLNRVLDRIGEVLEKSRENLLKMVLPLIENVEDLYFQFDGYSLHLPKNVLVKKTDKVEGFAYDPESFFIPKNELDMKSWRFNSPLDAIFVVHTHCLTNCIYCYADRREIVDCRIPLDRIKEIIREAKALEMRSLDITGGEFFLYPDWEEVLAELRHAGFQPYLSTKCPLDSRKILKLKELGVKRIQISIDSLEKEEVSKILRVPDDYLPKIIDTLKKLDEKDFDIYINTQVLSINQDSIHGLIEFLLSLKNIKRINVGPAGFSLYKGIDEYRRIKPELIKLKKLETWINELKASFNGKVNLNFSGYSEKSALVDRNIEDRKESFQKRSRCTANFSAFIILPDGQVTICEELYWHPQFIIGDIKKQSIEEVWNSDKALRLYNITREMVRPESACQSCDEFDECHNMKGVCWKEILYSYGLENWDYPDPKCHRAPIPFREYYF